MIFHVYVAGRPCTRVRDRHDGRFMCRCVAWLRLIHPFSLHTCTIHVFGPWSLAGCWDYSLSTVSRTSPLQPTLAHGGRGKWDCQPYDLRQLCPNLCCSPHVGRWSSISSNVVACGISITLASRLLSDMVCNGYLHYRH